MNTEQDPPVVWAIAGTDPGGGAGIQADLKTMNRLGLHGCSVITALVAQNTQQVLRIEYPTAEMLAAQFDALTSSLPPDAIKIGMLGNATTVREVARRLAPLAAPVVCDPVMISTSGTSMLDGDAREVFVKELLPRVHILTPNLPEAEQLSGNSISSPGDIKLAADAIMALGVKAVLIKGGHDSGKTSQDYWQDADGSAWLSSPRSARGNRHGTGCTLSSAIASCLALGHTPLDAAVIAKSYVNQGMRLGATLVQPRAPLVFGDWPSDPADFPQVIRNKR